MVAMGRFRGVPIYFAPSWLVLAALLTGYYGPVIGDLVPHTSASTEYLTALAYAVLFAACVLAHELGHTAVSLALGNPVRRVVIFLLGGLSEIVRDPDRPRDELLVSAAGPAVSIALGALSLATYVLLPRPTVLAALALLLVWSNLVVAVFNLLPGLPLDGGRLLRAAVWAVSGSRTAGTQVAAWTGRVLAVGVAALGLLLDRGSFGVVAGVLSLVMAGYLWFGAGQSLRTAQLYDRLPDVSLRELLRPGLMVHADVSVAEALRRVAEGHARGLVVLDAAQRPMAIVDELQIGSVLPQRRPWTAITEVARPLEPGLVLNVALSGVALLEAVRATPAHEYLVVDDGGAPAGIFSMTDLAAALRAHA
jgi:Zn-dependent protease